MVRAPNRDERVEELINSLKPDDLFAVTKGIAQERLMGMLSVWVHRLSAEQRSAILEMDSDPSSFYAALSGADSSTIAALWMLFRLGVALLESHEAWVLKVEGSKGKDG